MFCICWVFSLSFFLGGGDVGLFFFHKLSENFHFLIYNFHQYFTLCDRLYDLQHALFHGRFKTLIKPCCWNWHIRLHASLKKHPYTQDESLPSGHLNGDWNVTKMWLNGICAPFSQLYRPFSYHLVDKWQRFILWYSLFLYIFQCVHQDPMALHAILRVETVVT